MLSIFRTNQALGNIFVLIYLIVLRFVIFIHPFSYVPQNAGVVSGWIYQWISPSGVFGQLCALALVFIQAVMINQLVAKYRISSEATLLPGVFYCLVCSMTPEFLSLSPILMGNTFVILSLYCLFAVYKNVRCADTIFDIGLWIGAASLFQFSYAILFFWALIGLSALRGIALKEWLMVLLGFLIPNFLTVVFLFWTDQGGQFFHAHVAKSIGLINLGAGSRSADYIKIALMTVLVLITLFFSGRLTSKRNISAQKYIFILFWLLLFSAATLGVQANFHIERLLIFGVPLGFLLAFSFLSMNAAAAEALHTLLFVCALLLQYEYMLV